MLRKIWEAFQFVFIIFIIFYGAVWITRMRQGPIFWFLILANIVCTPFVCLFGGDLDRCRMAWLVFSGIQGPFIGIAAIVFWTVGIGMLAEAIDGPGSFARVAIWYMPIFVGLAWWYIWSVLGYGILTMMDYDWCWGYHDSDWYRFHSPHIHN